MINGPATDIKLAQYLSDMLVPVEYGQAYKDAAVENGEGYSARTHAVEKFRQRYGERKQPGFVFIEGGLIALEKWFPRKEQLTMFAPDNGIVISADCILAYEAGYEAARREPYMIDHYRDAGTSYRHDRRRRGAIVEATIRGYFMRHYREFYLAPSNAGLYEKPASDDFRLRIGKKVINVDVKSLCEDGTWSKVRNPKEGAAYVLGELMESGDVRMCGVETGKWLKEILDVKDDVLTVEPRHFLSIEVLLVMLNVYRNSDYVQLKSRIKRPSSSP